VHFLASQAVNTSFQCSDALHACPATNTTRAAMAVLIAGAITAGGDAAVPNSGTFTESGGPRSYDCGTAGGSHFPDVLNTGPYCRHVNYLWALGVIDGFVDGTFQPNGMVTRRQMAKFISNGFALSLY
jgi:S-layer homology domain